MTYIVVLFISAGIVMGVDTRASYFTDWTENGQTVGKEISFYWDGNRKVFLLDKLNNPVGISAQGMLFWGDERLLLKRVIGDFEKTLKPADTAETVANKVNGYFRGKKRKRSGEFEVMHFIVSSVGKDFPEVFYVNTFGSGSVERVSPEPVKAGWIDGDGRASVLSNPEDISIEQAISFVENRILEEHRKRPPDVGDDLDILVLPKNGKPYWHKRSTFKVSFETYDALMSAIRDGKHKVNTLKEPFRVRYGK